MRPLIRALSFLALLLCFRVQGAYLFDEYQDYPDDYSDEKNDGFDKAEDNPADKKKQCNEPLAPEFGKVLVVGNFLEVGSRAIFTCEEGREMEGSMTSKCLDSLEWSFPSPKCVKKCSVLKVHHGQIGRPSFSFSSWRMGRWLVLPVGQKLEDKVLLKLRCDDKYEPLGKNTFEETVNCENGEWSPIPQCEPAKCRSKPPESANATANKVNGTHGEKVMYTCKPYFQKEVHETIVCEFGQWTGLVPVCKNIRTSEDDDFDQAEDMSADKKKCSVPKVHHGKIGRLSFFPWRASYMWRELPVGQIVEDEVQLKLRCDYKYNPLGKPTIEEIVACKDGEWSPIPQCEPAFNEEKDQLISSSTSIPIVTPAQQSALNTSTGNSCTCMYLSHDTNLVAYVGTKRLQSGSKVENNFQVKFHCIPFGYSLLNGPSEIKCQDCQWDSSVFPKCESRKAGEATLHINGEWQLLPGRVVGIEKGRILSITCEANGTGIVPQWNYLDAPRIYVDTYRDHYSGRNVSMLYIVEVDPIHVGKYQCFVPGYAPNIIEIQLVTDTDSAPVKCPKLENTNLFIRYTKEQSVGSVATMLCKDRNKILVGRTRQWKCLSDGQWSSRRLPLCKAQCLNIKGENLTISYSSRLYEGSIASFSCPPTHVLSGVNRTVCTRNSEWADPIPTCTRADINKPEDHPVNKKKCPNISSENLLVDHSRDLTEGSIATFHCPPTYVLSGESSTICTRSGVWANPIPKCLSVPGCRYPQKPIDLIIEPIKMFYRLGESIILSCPPGKTLSFDVIRVLCFSNGWSQEDLPRCIVDK